MQVSPTFAASLALFLMSAVLFMAALGTRSWARSGQRLTIGLWDYCANTQGQGDREWDCFSNYTEFTMATQAFSILAVVCYVSAFLLYLIYMMFPSLHQSRAATIGICLLGFSIVSLQIMAMIVFGVKVPEYFELLSRRHFTRIVNDLVVSWSFGLTIVSTLLGTVAGVCVFLELRNITMPEFGEG
ncbi:uncharacterized protein LOC135470384 [Liolophura sinensis]|uniref:uncharacterized protein LOC135470384 n=1 Tax=Liolophura sinensis TaxID=3198878 RepID=UPI0031581AAC